MNRIGERLRKLRNELGLSAKEVAQSIQVAESTYRAWESGRAIRGEPYVEISNLFEISVHELLTGEKTTPSSAHASISLIEKEISKLKSALNRLK